MTKSSVELSSSVGDYLKAIWLLGNGEAVSTNDLAAHLAVSAPSVSGMLARLQERGWIDYERYRGARPTASGINEAMRLIRRHRLLETFMIEHLGYGWDEVHDEAERLEHAVSDRFSERLAALLGHPTHDPHGDPIPKSDGSLPTTPNTPLAEVEIDATLTVSRLLSQDADVLAHLNSLGIRPGTRVTVLGREPLGGLLRVAIDGDDTAVSKELAQLIRGRIA
jgi:DtxR family Mn-dependent transcriptional regulator